MEDLLAGISDDVNRYLNLNELTTVSTVSTNTFFRGLNNMKYYRFMPKENGEEILMKLKNEEKVKLSDIKGSANVDGVSSFEETLLYMAAYNNNTEIVKLLIKTGADVNLTNKYRTGIPLHRIVMNDDIKIVKLMIERGANVNASNKSKATALIFAVACNNINIAKLLINEGANVNAADRAVRTPLYIAVKENYTDIVELLIKEGADVNIVSKYDGTPLHLAIHNNNTKMIELLKKAGAH